MGGKGGGGGDYYVQPADTSGYGTLEEAEATLAKQKPIDMSQYQQNINVKKAAASATAPEPPPVVTSRTAPPTDTGDTLARSVLKPPAYWANRRDLQPKKTKGAVETTQT